MSTRYCSLFRHTRGEVFEKFWAVTAAQLPQESVCVITLKRPHLVGHVCSNTVVQENPRTVWLCYGHALYVHAWVDMHKCFFFFFFISPSFSFPFCFSEGTFDLGFKEVPVKIPGNAKPVSPLTFKNKTREQCYKVDTKDSDILRTIFFTGRRLLYQEHQEPKDLNSSPSFFQLYLWHWPVLLSESQFLYLHSCIVRFSEDQVKMCANMFLNP